ncbi:hypothetical protein ACIG3E_32975 [Streptomyces sp. NPDC053474]|uniref:hypothetical protein n=1 Tax=Streptomyces sp. NPDC053474 TaxID=3365704 RepID=UPI0037CEE147
MTSSDETFIDLTTREEPLSLSEISRALGLKSRGNAQKWHKPPMQKVMEGKAPANTPALHAVVSAMSEQLKAAGITVSKETLESSRPTYPPQVVLALGKALGYLDAEGRIVEEIRNKGRGRWLPVAPTIDPRSQRPRVYINHLAEKMRINTESIEVQLHRERFTRPDGFDEIGRAFWWVPTANQILKERNITEGFDPGGSTEEAQA